MTEPVSTGTTLPTDKKNVFIGAPDKKYSGGLVIGPPAEDPSLWPTGAAEPLNDIMERLGMVSAGFIAKDGVTLSGVTSGDVVLDWNLDPIADLESEDADTAKIIFAEYGREIVQKSIWGDENVTVAENGELEIARQKGIVRPHRSLIWDMKMSDGRRIRRFAPDASVKDIAEIVDAKSGIEQIDSTWTLFAGVEGRHVYTWILPAEAAAAPTGE